MSRRADLPQSSPRQRIYEDKVRMLVEPEDYDDAYWIW